VRSRGNDRLLRLGAKAKNAHIQEAAESQAKEGDDEVSGEHHQIYSPQFTVDNCWLQTVKG
jgi:hypothetical protein